MGGVGGEPLVDGGGLVAGLAEQRGEAAARVRPGGFGRLAGGAAYDGDPGTGGGEGDGEGLLAVCGAVTPGADTAVS